MCMLVRPAIVSIQRCSSRTEAWNVDFHCVDTGAINRRGQMTVESRAHMYWLLCLWRNHFAWLAAVTREPGTRLTGVKLGMREARE